MKLHLSIGMAAVSLLMTSVGHAAPSIDLSPNISPTDVQFGPGAPNFTSPSYAAYVSNALTGLRSGGTRVGGSQYADPAAYNVIGGIIHNGVGTITLRPGDLVASEFVSWRGDLAPAGAFANENGTHYRSSVHISDQSTFTLGDVTYSGSYDPALAPPGCCSATLDLIVAPGSERFVGIYWGADGAAGGMDDIIYDVSNPLLDPAALLNEIFFVGIGDFAVATVIPGVTNQQQFDDWAAFVESYGSTGVLFRYSYSLRGITSQVDVSVVPEPGTLSLLGVCLLALSWRRYNRALSAS
jgi:PEP-CTERM motif